ncbi:hypothetical protein [Chishuiella sp.]|uniref:hypothetical protein n=1 Tax=Chishuiella sp. TaxID=1969467 RepID=UPI0028A947A6|nr:hypothetical protein [Chishuiella sp.]
MTEIKNLLEKYDMLYEELSNDNYEVEQGVYDMEEEVHELLRIYDYQEDYDYNGKTLELDALKKLLKKIKSLKREFDFYDEEAELDMMFPDRHDEDFDEDSMGYDSVFGDD